MGNDPKDNEGGGFAERLRAMQAAVPTSRLWRLAKSGRAAIGAASAAWGISDLAAVEALTARLGELKGTAMKAGQLLSYVDPSLSPELRRTLAALQTSAPSAPFAHVKDELRSALGDRGVALAGALSPEPIAVASIGQVHRGRLPDGSEVAVKVRHPGIVAALEADFQAAGAGASLASILMPHGGETVRETLAEARAAILEECDFLREAERQTRFRALFHDHPVLSIPEVFPELCAHSVLTTRWCSGRSFDELLASNPPQQTRDRLGVALFDFYLGTLYRHGLFHADPHPGNYAFTGDDHVVVYDFGCVREFDPPTLAAFAALAQAMRDDDMAGMGRALARMGGAPPSRPDEVRHVRALMREFFRPLLTPGPRRIEAHASYESRSILDDKRAVARLRLPGRLLFLFRLRFGLYSVLASLGAVADWSALEAAHASAVSRLGT